MKSEPLADALASSVPLSCFPQPVSLNCTGISTDQRSKEVRYHPELRRLVGAVCTASTLVRKRNASEIQIMRVFQACMKPVRSPLNFKFMSD